MYSILQSYLHFNQQSQCLLGGAGLCHKIHALEEIHFAFCNVEIDLNITSPHKVCVESGNLNLVWVHF